MYFRNGQQLRYRTATLEDVPAIGRLIEESLRGLWTADYTPQQTEAAIPCFTDVDTQLIRDGTYTVVECGAGGGIVAGGGWSFREKLYGGDAARRARENAVLDPATDGARVRAFFVHPSFARRGIGRRLLEIAETGAARAGFTKLELVSTLAGRSLYLACGFSLINAIRDTLPNGVTIDGWRMSKTITGPGLSAASAWPRWSAASWFPPRRIPATSPARACAGRRSALYFSP